MIVNTKLCDAECTDTPCVDCMFEYVCSYEYNYEMS